MVGLGLREALVDGWRFSMWVGVVLALGALAYLAAWGPRSKTLDAVALDTDFAFEPEAA